MKKLAFRFDIDTHKCIRDGVPNLIKLSQETNVSFSFFLNLGRAISLRESLCDALTSRDGDSVDYEMMKSSDKFGIYDFFIAALINPPNHRYCKQIRELCSSLNEVGIHGGRNHALWQKYAKSWDKEKIRGEIKWSMEKLNDITSGYKPLGFASPCWEENRYLMEVLKEYGFAYSGDLRVKDCDSVELIEKDGVIPKIGVNLLGEPGGVAFFENCRVKGWSTEEIIDYTINSVIKHDVCVLYDHPYYAGIKELSTIREMIKALSDNSINVVTLYNLIKG